MLHSFGSEDPNGTKAWLLVIFQKRKEAMLKEYLLVVKAAFARGGLIRHHQERTMVIFVGR